MTIAADQLLTELAKRNAACTLSIPHEPLAIVRRSRILQADEDGLWVALNPKDIPVAEKVIAQALPVHTTVRSDDQDILFHALPEQVVPTFISPDKRCVCALKLHTPENVATSQRRKTFRVTLSELDELSVRIWRVNDYVLIRDRVLPSQELPCAVRNLSEGGFAAVVYPSSDEAINLKSNQRFRVELKFGRHEMTFEARLRYPEATQRDDEAAECGFEFIHNDRDVESRRHRQKLQLVLSEVQRNAVRREQASA